MERNLAKLINSPGLFAYEESKFIQTSPPFTAGTIDLQPSATVAEDGGTVQLCATLTCDGADQTQSAVTVELSTADGSGKLSFRKSGFSGIEC